MRPNVRRLTKHDVDEFIQIRTESVRKNPAAYSMDEEILNRASRATTESIFDGPVEKNGLVLGAFSSGLVAIAGLTLIARKKAQHIATVWGFFVKEKYWKQGVGDALIEALLMEAKGLGFVEQVRVTLPTEHVLTKDLFERHGFVSYGCEKRGRKTDSGYHDIEYLQVFLNEI